MPSSDPSLLERKIGFARVARKGPFVAVSGTAPIADDGSVAAPSDLYAQTRRCLEIIQRALGENGLSLDSVIRTRVLLTDIRQWQHAARAHAEFFADTRPACTFAQVSGFIDAGWLVEIEADAVDERCLPDINHTA